ncbi:hypothetical protein COCON_G00109970, partial [Conger conger]
QYLPVSLSSSPTFPAHPLQARSSSPRPAIQLPPATADSAVAPSLSPCLTVPPIGAPAIPQPHLRF